MPRSRGLVALLLGLILVSVPPVALGAQELSVPIAQMHPGSLGAPVYSVGDVWVYTTRSEEVISGTSGAHYWTNGTTWVNVTAIANVTLNGTLYEVYLIHSEVIEHTHELSSGSPYDSDIREAQTSWTLVSNLSSAQSDAYLNETYTIGGTPHWYSSHSTASYLPFWDTYHFPVSVGGSWNTSSRAHSTDFWRSDTSPGGNWANSTSFSRVPYSCPGTTTVSVPAGSYLSYEIVSSNASTGYNSSTFFASTAGNMVRYYSFSTGTNYWLVDWEDLTSTSFVPPVVYQAPSAPLGPVATVAGGQVDLSWSPPASDGNASITNYLLYRGTSSGSETFLSMIGTNRSYADAAVLGGTTYDYEVSAVNSVGEGPRSLEVSATVPAGTQPPGVPLGLAAAPGNQQVALTWSAPATGGAPSGYQVSRGAASGGPYSVVATPSGTSWTDPGVSNGVTYWYEVAAVNSAGTSGESAPVSATPTGTGGAPATPLALAASAGNGWVRLSWSAAGVGGTPTNYNVYRATASGGPFSRIAALSSTSDIDSAVLNGVTYWYEVNAQNAYGFSGNTTPISAAPSSALPPSPYTLSGRVVDAASGAGIAGVTLTLSSTSTLTTQADSNGDYSFADLGNGSYTMVASAPGYASQTVHLSIAGADTTRDLSLTRDGSTGGTGSGGGSETTVLEIGGLLTVGALAAVGIILVVRRRARVNPRR